MRTGTTLAATLLALTSLPLLSQQGSQPGTPGANPAANQPPAATQPNASPAQEAPPAVAPATSAAMSSLDGELVSKLDSKTAKTGDSVEVVTRTTAKTADGKDIPKGSKLVGKVIAVKPSESGTTSQVAVAFDHLELKDGSNMPVQSQIASIGTASVAPAGSAAATPAQPTTDSSPTMPAGRGSTPGVTSQTSPSVQPNPAMGNSTSDAATPAKGVPAPGTVVAHNGNISIATTAIPGVLLANNAPGQKDPRLASVSSVLLGNKKDVQLDSGTPMVVMIASITPGQ